SPSLFVRQTKTKEGIVSDEFSRGAVAIDITLTDELIREGTGRDTVRQCQLARKEAGFDVDRHIEISITSDSASLIDALREQSDHMASELLADRLLIGEPLGKADYVKEADIGDDKAVISVMGV
ncbi:MAG: DUF5915 domain-containing protein, partial [Clostridia bacterium]|nr:DUF5915 domain-containing protein [Clostridia bacterium]